MQDHIEKRNKETGKENPMYHQENWSGTGVDAFATSQEAYDTLHIGDAKAARKLQAKTAKKK